MVLGAGLEPACLSAYAPQTYVSAIPPPELLDLEYVQNLPSICAFWQLALAPTRALDRDRNYNRNTNPESLSVEFN